MIEKNKRPHGFLLCKTQKIEIFKNCKNKKNNSKEKNKKNIIILRSKKKRKKRLKKN